MTGLEAANDTSNASYNIWTHRRTGPRASGAVRGEPRERGTSVASAYRCRPALDSGSTRGARAGVTYACLYFARGLCHRGAACDYLHRVPTAADAVAAGAAPQLDVFGRDRLADARATKGAGSMSREHATLYVNLGGAAALPKEELLRLLTANFSEWGPLDEVAPVPAKGIAFVRYRWRASAEFAKAAMHQQALLGAPASAAHILDTRWAHDDANPRAQVAAQRGREAALVEALAGAVAEADPATKRARLGALRLAGGYAGGAVGEYPDTSAQYAHAYQGWDVAARAGGAGAGAGDADACGDGDEEEDDGDAEHAGAAPGGGGGSGGGGGRGGGGGGGDGAWAEDDVRRYLSAEELAELEAQEAARGGGGGAAPPAAEAQAAEAARAPESQRGADAAGGALALLGGYASSDSGGG